MCVTTLQIEKQVCRYRYIYKIYTNTHTHTLTLPPHSHRQSCMEPVEKAFPEFP